MKDRFIHRSRNAGRGAGAFIKRNGAYIAAALLLAAVGTAAAVIPAGENGKGSGSPAEHSLDERLEDAESSIKPEVQVTPAPRTHAPVLTPEPSSGATLTPQLPELTAAPSREPEPTAKNKLNSPVEGRRIKPYSMDALIYSVTLRQWMTHSGVDIAAPKGSEVRAVEAGTVERVYEDDLFGVCVLIDHGEGMKTLYCGLKKDPPVNEGEAVGCRALIGCIGDTAISECADQSHLHFEVIKDGLPVDPELYVLITKSE